MKPIFYILPLITLIAANCSQQNSKNSTTVNATASPARLTKATTPENLSIETACALAVNHHPSLATYPMDRRAADARILKATKIPNPSLSIDAEDLLGTGGLSGLSNSVLNALLSQVVERGGKRKARTDVARSGGLVMDAEYEIRRLEVIRKTSELYLDTVAARENIHFLKKSLENSKETARLVTKLSEAGRVTITSVQQAQLDIQKNELELARAHKDAERASQALTAQWGDTRPTNVTAQRLESPPATLGSKASHQAGLSAHPKIRHSKALVSQSEALLKLAKANKLGDLSIGGGVRHANGPDETSALLEFSMPLPIFDNREDAVTEMTALSEKAATELAGTRREIDNEFSLAWSDLVSAHQTAQSIKNKILPTSGSLFKSAEASFRAGKITSLEYLAARQQFQEIQRKWLEARRDFQLKSARLQALTNRPL